MLKNKHCSTRSFAWNNFFDSCVFLFLFNRQLLAFLGFIVYIKTVKYLSIFRFFRVMVRVVERCAMEISWFAVLLVLIFFGFALAFFVRFGDQDANFSTVMSSFLVLFFYLISGTTADADWFAPGTLSLHNFTFKTRTQSFTIAWNIA